MPLLDMYFYLPILSERAIPSCLGKTELAELGMRSWVSWPSGQGVLRAFVCGHLLIFFNFFYRNIGGWASLCTIYVSGHSTRTRLEVIIHSKQVKPGFD